MSNSRYIMIPCQWIKVSALLWLAAISTFLISCNDAVEEVKPPISISGIYPHLANYNHEDECGTGAVVAWADRLWLITYGPHLVYGSSDKLIEITSDLQRIVRQESIGGTPANRMIHRESNQLFIGPYAIDKDRNVRTMRYQATPGRPTGNARHLSDPEGRIYLATMEEGFYDIDVNSLKAEMLHEDENVMREKAEKDSTFAINDLLPGAHGKGLYSGQGVMIYSNNGELSPEAMEQFDVESEVLADWDGKDSRVIRRNQFVEVIGPGGIWGNKSPDTDPIWTTGWDHKSIIVGVRGGGSWSFFRLPKASHSYDGAHGWNTEWPRIRDVGTEQIPDYLMTMHGMFWRFPGSFSSTQISGIRPRSAYLKVIGDFTRWKDQLVFGCDDSAKREFLNKRKAKGGIEGPGQSNSNLWFTPLDRPDHLGSTTAGGAVWLNEHVKAGAFSEPFLFAGWTKRSAWVHNGGSTATVIEFEVDPEGDGNWQSMKTLELGPAMTELVEFGFRDVGEWIRAAFSTATILTLHFAYQGDSKGYEVENKFSGLASILDSSSLGGLLFGLEDDRKSLGVAAYSLEQTDRDDSEYYELSTDMKLEKVDDPTTHRFIKKKFAIPENVVLVEESSVLVVDDQGRRWRLPLGNKAFDAPTNAAQLRICREVATERDLFSCHGTFYELPAENADGYAKIRPIASHDYQIVDYASYRGLLVRTGVKPAQEEIEYEGELSH